MLELLYTEDASETELTVKSGSVDVGLGIDVMRVLRAYAKGDPLIGANTGPAVSVLDSNDAFRTLALGRSASAGAVSF